MQEKKQGGRITAGAEMSTNTSKFPYTLLKAVQGHYAHLSSSASKAIRIAQSRWVLLTQLLPFRSHTSPPPLPLIPQFQIRPRQAKTGREIEQTHGLSQDHFQQEGRDAVSSS